MYRSKFYWQSLIPGGLNSSVKVIDGDIKRALKTFHRIVKENGTLEEVFERQRYIPKNKRK